MTQTNKRRNVVKLLALAGLSLYLPACASDQQKKQSSSKKNKPDDPISEIEESIKSNNVTYLKQMNNLMSSIRF